MTFTRDHLRRLAEVAYAQDLGFVELVGLAELDPAEAFKGADIKGADLRDQDLAGFDFAGARFIDCALFGADLSRARGVTPETLANADYDGTTRLPPALLTALRDAFWATGHPPSWAEDWGHDPYGPWVTFRVPGTEVTQRMRWIPPGRFMMGSPERERGRYHDEGPQHEVTIAHGFWMFETQCTEALWTAVTVEPPRGSLGSDFPVTGVSWNDAQGFVERLNTALPGLSIGLPGEARWEYACRAGTVTPYSFGRRITKKLARHGTMKGPVAVSRFPPNPWGLRDMHGNVDEWCEDEWHVDYSGAPADATAWVSDSAAGRVVRGGAWFDDARGVRAACRVQVDPDGSDDFLGFRCARVQTASGAEEAEPAALARGRKRGAPPPAWAAGSASERSGERKISIPHAPRRGPQPPEKPAWASAAGIDEFGIYALLDFHAGSGLPPVTQRLRLIPPGQFWMGSPKREPGRSDAEGPRHKVSIERGFWLFDTPCTQAVWEAVMGSNPSRFKDPSRPVENVSFYDVQVFFARLNEGRPDLDLTLPSEAQWEYACRAGTKTATYAGPIEFLDANTAPVLDSIAWYGGGATLPPVETPGPVDARDIEWPFMSPPNLGIRPVAQKDPNGWGLYDMLGNVWEWCEDEWHKNYARAPIDGSAWLDLDGNGGRRVYRGGAWLNNARFIRSACRGDSADSYGDFNIGFRAARRLD